MPDNRDKGRQQTHDTGSAAARPRDDLRTANKKRKPNEQRDEQRDKEEREARESAYPETTELETSPDSAEDRQ